MCRYLSKICPISASSINLSTTTYTRIFLNLVLTFFMRHTAVALLPMAVASATPSALTFQDVQNIAKYYLNTTSVASTPPSALSFDDAQKIAENFFNAASTDSDTPSHLTFRDFQNIAESYYNTTASDGCDWLGSYI